MEPVAMADTVSVTCPECDKVVKIPEEMLGRKPAARGARRPRGSAAPRGSEKKAAKKPGEEGRRPGQEGGGPGEEVSHTPDDDNDGKATG